VVTPAGRSSEPKEFTRKMQDLSGPSLVLLGGTMTFASIDWVMSLDPHWVSTIFGVLFMAGTALTAIAFIITMIVFLSSYKPMNEVIAGRHLNDLGKLMLAFVMLWAYFFVLAIFDYLVRQFTGRDSLVYKPSGRRLEVIAGFIILFHFILPFFLLLPKKANRNPRI
jgi:hypothetical protein